MIGHVTRKKAIAANLEALHLILSEANTAALDAVAQISAGNQNGAMGAAASIENMLTQATALYGAARALHIGKGR
jgi:hypothetical protein